MTRRALALVVLLLTACGRPSRATPGGPPVGQPAPALASIRSQLQAAQFPVYLPSRLPGSGGASPYHTTVSATATTYSVAVAQDTATGSTLSILIAGGPIAAFTANLMQWTGTPQTLHLSDGTVAFFYPGQGIGWVQNRWQLAVMDEGGRPARPDGLLPQVAQLRGALPRSGNPIGQGTEGQVIVHVGGNPPDIAVVWEDGAFAYEVAAHGVSAVDVAETLVRVWR